MPDRISLYKNNMQEHSDDLNQLRTRVRMTLVHEIGHHFRLHDKKLQELVWAQTEHSASPRGEQRHEDLLDDWA